jgi:uncharacterized membrane protein
MTYKALKTVEGITCIVMAAVLAVTLVFKIWYLPLIAILATAIMFGVLIFRMKEVYADERTKAIDEKAGKATVSISGFVLLIAGSIFLAISSDRTTGMGLAAIMMYATVVGVNIIGFLTKLYYKAKLGDR